MTRQIFLIFTVLLISAARFSYADASVNDLSKIGQQYVKDWVIGGPFSPSTLDADFLNSAVEGGESKVAKIGLGAGDSASTTEGRTVLFQQYIAKGNAVDFVGAIGSDESATAYAFGILRTTQAQTVDFGLGVDGAIAIWVNGARLYRNQTMQSMAFDSDLLRDVNLKSGDNYVLVKVARRASEFAFEDIEFNLGRRVSFSATSSSTPWGFALRVLPHQQATIISGTATDTNGEVLSRTKVRLIRSSKTQIETTTDYDGKYKFILFPGDGTCNLSATLGNLGTWKTGIKINKGNLYKVNLVLRESVHVQGRITMLDKKTPHTSTVVEAIRDGKVAAKALSNEDGVYKFINLKTGQYTIRSHVRGKKAYYNSGKKVSVQRNTKIKNADFQFAPTKKGTWRKYSNLDGLAHRNVNDIYISKNGSIWFATDDGVSRYDGKFFDNFSKADGLVSNQVRAICGAEKGKGLQTDGLGGTIWFATNKGISSYDGRNFQNYTTENSNLIGDNVLSAHRTRNGDLWFGTDMGAIQYNTNKNRFQSYMQKEHRELGIGTLPDNHINDINSDPVGDTWFATNGGVARFNDKKIVEVLTMADGLPDHRVRAICSDGNKGMWFGTESGLAHYDGQRISEVFTIQDGLWSNRIRAIFRDSEGIIWFASTPQETSIFERWSGNITGVITKYDGNGFIMFTPEDGLVSASLSAINSTPDGLIWFSSKGDGVSSYDEKGIINFNLKDGLPNNNIIAIHESKDKKLWVAASSGGIALYDGKRFSSVDVTGNVTTIQSDAEGSLWLGTQRQGAARYKINSSGSTTNLKIQDRYNQSQLGHRHIGTIYHHSDNSIWFGTRGGGATSYDGTSFSTINDQNGLPDDDVRTIAKGINNSIWVGTENGAILYENNRIVKTIQTKDGLVNNWVNAIYCQPDGVVWLATGHYSRGDNSGLSRYNGKSMINVTSRSTGGGLASDAVRTIYTTPDGRIWFGTIAGGVTVHNPMEGTWTQLSTKDGLANNTVNAIYQDSSGSLWFGTENGLTQYNRGKYTSQVRIVSVRTNKKDNQNDAGIVDFPKIPAKSRATIEYSVVDYKVPFDKRQYRCRVIDSNNTGTWEPITKETVYDHVFPRAGSYTFEVQFVDPELNYSEPTRLVIEVTPPPFLQSRTFFGLIAFLAIVALGGGGTQTIKGLQQRREISEYRSMAVQELEDAHNIQLDLIPKTPPETPKFEFAGTCLPASEVGGDFFDYIVHEDSADIGVAIADVSGKRMQGAMNAVMTNGVLHMAAREENSQSPTHIVEKVNSILSTRMKQDTNVTMIFGFLNPEDQTFNFVNAGHHAYPILVRNKTVERLEHFGFPLGMKHPIEYQARQIQLQSGDLVILMTDGIIEPIDEHGIMYADTDKLDTLLSNLPDHVPLNGIIDQIINDAKKHADNAQQQDDITVIAIRATA